MTPLDKLSIRLSAEVRATLQQRADQCGVTLGTYVAEVLAWHSRGLPLAVEPRKRGVGALPRREQKRRAKVAREAKENANG